MFRILRVVLLLVCFGGCAHLNHFHDTLALNAKYAAPPSTEPPKFLFSRGEVTLALSYREGERGDPPFSTPYQFQKDFFKAGFFSYIKEDRFFEKMKSGNSPSKNQRSDQGLSIDLQIHNPYLGFQGRNTLLSIFGWIFFGLGVQWFHDELYEMGFDFEIVITDMKTKKRLLSKRVPLACKDHLNFHERTSGVFPYIYTNVIPPTFLSADPKTLTQNLAPLLMSQMVTSIKEQISRIEYVEKSVIVSRIKGKSPGVDLQVVVPKTGSELSSNTSDVWINLLVKQGKKKLSRVSIRGDATPLLDQPVGKPIVNPNETKVTLLRSDVAFTKGAIEIVVEVKKQKQPISLILSKVKKREWKIRR